MQCTPEYLRASPGVVGTHGTASSSMALGFYVRQVRSQPELSAWHLELIQPYARAPHRGPCGSQLAQRGLIGVALAQSPEYVAPHGAAQALYGTNPIGTHCSQVLLRWGAAI